MPRHETAVVKPYPDFPLFAHKDGRWKKKIGGKQVSFGPVLVNTDADPDAYDKGWRAARTAYDNYRIAVQRGEQLASDPYLLQLGDGVDAYLTKRHADVDQGSLKPRTFADMRDVLTTYRNALGAGATVGELENDPKAIEQFAAALKERCGFHTYNRSSSHIRSMWKWFTKPEIGLLPRPFKWVAIHKKRPLREYRKQRRLERAAGVLTTFESDEIAALLRYGKPFIHGIVTLAYFANYGNTDISEFPKTAIKIYKKDEVISLHGRPEIIPAGWALIDFPRPKTEIDRAAIVPPCVVEALDGVTALKRPSKPDTRDLLFRTQSGKRLVYDLVYRDAAGLISHTRPTDNVAQKFDKLVGEIGKCTQHGWVERKKFARGKALKPGEKRERQNLCPQCLTALTMMAPRGFYCLRHTATTFATGSGASSDTRDLFEGHGSGGVRQAFYLDPTKLHDLLLIARDLLQRVTNTTAHPTTQNAKPPTPDVTSASAPAAA